MSAIKIVGNSSGAGIFTISSPNSNTDRTLTLPNNNGTIISSAIPTLTQVPEGSIVKTTSFSNSTRTALSNSANTVLWSLTPIVKLYSSTESDLIVYGNLAGYGTYSYFMGLYAHIAGSTTLTTDGTAYQDIHINTSQTAGTQINIFIIGKRFQSLNAGSCTLDIGWNARNADAGNKPFNIWNPNSTDDARTHQIRSFITVYEVLR